MVLIVLVASYILGILLTAVSSLFYWPLFWLLGKLAVLLSKKLAEAKNLALTEGPLEEAERMKKASEVNVKVGANLAKMRAESVLCQNLLTGFLITAIVLRLEKGCFVYLGPTVAAITLLVIAVIHRKVVYKGQLFVDDPGSVEQS